MGITFNARVIDSKSKPIQVIVDRGEIVDIQYDDGLGDVVAITFRGRVTGARYPHFHRYSKNYRENLQNRIAILFPLTPSRKINMNLKDLASARDNE